MGTFQVAEYKTIKRVRHKLCRGVLHPDGKFVPVTNFYPGRNNRKERHRSHCIDCEFARKGFERNVVVTQMWTNWLHEIVSRVGVEEACRQLGMSNAWYRWFNRTKPRTMQRRTARNIVRVLRKLRANKTVRHRDSIRHGSAQRGHRERVPVTIRDFYRSRSDLTDN